MRTEFRFGAKSALALAACVLASVSAEGMYRFYLARRLSSVDLGEGSIFACSAPIHRFHRTFGYEYVPATKFTQLVYRRGKPVWLARHRINSHGNMSREPLCDPDRRIYVFGDSFSASQHNDLSWPDHFQDLILAEAGIECEVRNYARDGFGLVQMLKLAADTIATAPAPDMLVFAFISDDLTRGMSWRSAREIRGRIRVLTTLKPVPSPSIDESADAYLVEPAIAFATPPLSDDSEIIRLLVSERNRFIAERAFFRPLLSPKRSFLAARLMKGDPLYGVAHPSQLSRIPVESYAEMEELSHAIRTLQEAPFPIILVHLPVYQEILDGVYALNSQQLKLKYSLKDELRATQLDLITLFSREPSYVDSLIWPFDFHPSEEGLREYARAAWSALDWIGVLANEPACAKVSDSAYRR